MPNEKRESISTEATKVYNLGQDHVVTPILANNFLYNFMTLLLNFRCCFYVVFS